MKRFLLAGLLVLAASAAMAHSRIDGTVPADGATLAAMPGEIVLAFARPMRLTRVRMTRDGGQAVELDLGGHKSFATRFAIPVTGQGKGAYRVEWRGLSVDGHAVRGGFAFRVE